MKKLKLIIEVVKTLVEVFRKKEQISIQNIEEISDECCAKPMLCTGKPTSVNCRKRH